MSTSLLRIRSSTSMCSQCRTQPQFLGRYSTTQCRRSLALALALALGLAWALALALALALAWALGHWL